MKRRGFINPKRYSLIVVMAMMLFAFNHLTRISVPDESTPHEALADSEMPLNLDVEITSDRNNYHLNTLCYIKETDFDGYWERALLDADFVRNKMVGNDIREYVRIIENNRAYELFTLTDSENREFADFHETRLFISNIIDGEYDYLVSFNITGRRANAHAGLVLVDVDFDGANDVLVWLGHEGNQGVISYAAFLSRGDSYIESNFEDIPFPALANTNDRIMGGIRSWAAGHYSFLYAFIDGKLVMTDSLIREACRDTFEWRYVVTLRDGQEVNETYWYANDQEKIYMLFYSDESPWAGEWQSIFMLH